jgi:Tfp pilus assembly protein PilO
VFASYKGVIEPMRQKVQDIDLQIEAQLKKLKKNQKTISKADAIQSEYAGYIERFSQVGTNEQTMSAALSEIEKTAGEMSLKISDLKPNKVKSQGSYNRFSVSLTIDGGLEDILRLLYTLQSEPYFYTVDELRFDKSSRQNHPSMKTRIVLTKILIPNSN